MQSIVKERDGFTLVETLAAFAILTLVLSQLLSGASRAARNESRADFLLRASRQGQSQLEALGVDGSISAGETRGQYEDGLEWILSIEPRQIAKGATGAPVAASYFARLVIYRPPRGAESLTLSTLRIVSFAEAIR
jgi:general secretion pathway protein I